MTAHEASMKESGEFTALFSHGQPTTDEELKRAIAQTQLAIAYLKGRGIEFSLATFRLQMDLNNMEQAMEFRKRRES